MITCGILQIIAKIRIIMQYHQNIEEFALGFSTLNIVSDLPDSKEHLQI